MNQYGRFEGDVAFWRNRLSEPNTVTVATKVHPNDRLHFGLVVRGDFNDFEDALKGDLQNVNWSKTAEDAQQPEGDTEL